MNRGIYVGFELIIKILKAETTPSLTRIVPDMDGRLGKGTPTDEPLAGNVMTLGQHSSYRCRTKAIAPEMKLSSIQKSA